MIFQDDTIRPTGVTTEDRDIKRTGVDASPRLQMTTAESEIEQTIPNETEQYEYRNLQEMVGALLSHESIKTILQIQSENEKQNYRNTLDFITHEVRRDQMIDDYILAQYSLRTGLKKFFIEGGKKSKNERTTADVNQKSLWRIPPRQSDIRPEEQSLTTATTRIGRQKGL